MRHRQKFKTALAGLLAASALALGTTAAQAFSANAGVFAPGAGDAANPIVINVADPGEPGGSGFFNDTINFDLGSFTHFNMTSTVSGIDPWFGASIFENQTDGQVPGGAAATSFTSFPLADLGIAFPPGDYHLHPAGLAAAGGSYELTLWGSTTPVPLPAAAWLFGSGVIGLVGLARRKMAAKA